MTQSNEDQPPIGGSIIRFEYLWNDDSLAGEVQGEKERPVVVALSQTAKGRTIVLPITHSEPYNKDTAIEIPDDERALSGLDNNTSWIILSECNTFVWPSENLGLIPGSDTYLYGEFSYEFFQEILAKFQAVIKARRSKPVDR